MSRITTRVDFVSVTISLIPTVVLLGSLVGYVPVSASLSCVDGTVACLDDSVCYSDADRCDNIPDCDDGSDERNCTKSCGDDEFYCAVDDECFSLMYKCDGDSDCSDGSDELDCDNVTCSLEGEFMCVSDKKCIVGSLRCDGVAHCHDSSDENDCVEATESDPGPNPCDPELTLDCKGDRTNCIPLRKRCDGHEDCANGEDELESLCSSNSSESRCAVDNGGCSHHCVENIHGHHCICPEGYDLGFDHKTCEGDEPELWATNGSILVQYHLHSSDRQITNLGGTPHSIAYDRKNEKIFWIDSQRKVIYWSNKDSAGLPEVLINTLIDVPAALAFDWVHDNLYWADAGQHTRHTKIEVVTLGGEEKWRSVVLIPPEVEHPKYMVVDPRENEGYLYWAQGGLNPVIRRAGLDGSEPQTIVSSDLGNVHGLALDLADDRLFWVDSKLNIIVSLGLHGRDREVLVTFVEYPKHPIGIGVFEDWVYWADIEAKSIHKMEKFLRQDEDRPTITTVLDQLTNPHSIVIYHKLKQPEGESYCGNNSGGCSHICLPSPHFTHFRCRCPLSTDKTKHYVVDAENSSSCLLVDGASASVTVTSLPGSMTSATSAGSQTNFINSKSLFFTTYTAGGGLSTPWGGDRSTSGQSGSHGDNMWVYIGVAGAAGLLIILVLSIVGYKLYARHVSKNLHFDNPVFEQKPLRNSERQADSRA